MKRSEIQDCSRRNAARITLALHPGYIHYVRPEIGMDIWATNVRIDDHTLWVDLSDGRTLGVPLAWFPRLLNASPMQRQQVELSRAGLHWEALDEDISIAGLLAGRGDRIKRSPDGAQRNPR